MRRLGVPALSICIGALLALSLIGLTTINDTPADELGDVARRSESSRPARIEVTGDLEVTVPVDNGAIRWSAFPGDTTNLVRPLPVDPDTGLATQIIGSLSQLGSFFGPPPAPPEPEPYRAPPAGTPAVVGVSLRGSGARYREGDYSVKATVAEVAGTIGIHEHRSEFTMAAGKPPLIVPKELRSETWFDGLSIRGPLTYLLVRPDGVGLMLLRAEDVARTDEGYSFRLPVPGPVEGGAVRGTVVTDSRDRVRSVTVQASGTWGDGLVWRCTSSAQFSYPDSGLVVLPGREATVSQGALVTGVLGLPLVDALSPP